MGSPPLRGISGIGNGGMIPETAVFCWIRRGMVWKNVAFFRLGQHQVIPENAVFSV